MLRENNKGAEMKHSALTNMEQLSGRKEEKLIS